MLKKFKWIYVLYALLYITAIMMIGMVDVVGGKFDPSLIRTAEYWRRVSIFTAASLIILFTGFARRLAWLLLHDERYTKKQTILDGLAKAKGTGHIDKWLAVKNPERKKFVYKEKIKKKLSRLDNGVWYKPWTWGGAKIADQILYFEDEDERKETNKYCVKRSQLEKLMSDEYLDKALKFISIKYPALSKSFMTNGYEMKGELPWLIEKATLKMFRDLSPRFAMSISFMAFIMSFIPTFETEMWTKTWWLMFSIQAAVLIFNHFYGDRYADTWLETKIMVDQQTRWEMYDDYNDWCKEEGLTDAKNTNGS